MSRLKKWVQKNFQRPRFSSLFSPTSAQRIFEPEFDVAKCRMQDAHRTGYFNRTTGELFRGFYIKPGDSLVDVGCGDGGTCTFALHAGADVTAVDISPKAVETVAINLAKEAKQCASQGRQVGAYQVILSDSNPLPLQDRTATKVISMEVMEHVDDPASFLAELVRVGKPGADYLLTVPDPVAENLQRDLAPPSYWSKPNHVRIFQRDEFDRLVQSSGLEIVQRTHNTFYWSMWWVLFWASPHEFSAPENPVLKNWSMTWKSLMDAPNGEHILKTLDQFMPKSQIIIARKAA